MSFLEHEKAVFDNYFVCVCVWFNFFDAHRELARNQDPISYILNILGRLSSADPNKFILISPTSFVQIKIVWIIISVAHYDCNVLYSILGQRTFHWHFHSPFHQFHPYPHVFLPSLHQGTPYVNRFRPQLLHLRTESHQTRGYRGSYKAPFTVPRFRGVSTESLFRLNSWLRGFRIDLVVMAVKNICDGNTRTLYLYKFYIICLKNS